MTNLTSAPKCSK